VTSGPPFVSILEAKVTDTFSSIASMTRVRAAETACGADGLGAPSLVHNHGVGGRAAASVGWRLAADIAEGAGPNWADAVSAIAGALTLVALVLGGLVGYVRFLRRRVLHASCHPDLAVVLTRVAGGDVLQISATATNEGSYRLRFPAGSQQIVTICKADQAMWDDAQGHGGEILWSEGLCCRYDLLTTEGVRDGNFLLEPGQRLVRSLLVPIPGDPGLAYYVNLFVEARAQWIWRLKDTQDWSTERTIVREAVHG
jgi:hypothetical protein